MTTSTTGSTGRRIASRAAALLAAAVVASALVPPPAAAQYFGRNKVRYEDFDFRVLHTDHFDIHFYPEEAEPVRDAARMAERWYTRLSGLFDYRYGRRGPVILYADHPDFQQTNVVGGLIGEATGGVTEALRERVVMPLTGIYRENDHVLGHELVHQFQYRIAESRQGGGLSGLSRLPLWLIEGLAEYLSLGREDPHTAMWLRDAAARDDLPTIDRLSRDPRYFPYRFGHALWAYIGGRWGDPTATRLFRAATREGWDRALESVLGIDDDELSGEWHAAIRATYLEVLEGRTPPARVGERIIAQERPGGMNLSPVLSPDGRYVAFFSERGLFTVDLYLADARTGEIIKELAGPGADPHIDAISFTNSAGTWSPDGRKFAFIVFAEGDNQLAVLDVATGEVERRIAVPGVGAISGPAWSPDGDRIAFSGVAGGISDLYLYDLRTGAVRRLTSDRYADLQPAWSPDGRTLAFSTDRGPDTDFGVLAYAPMRIGVVDVASGAIRLLTPFEGAKHINPQFSPDGRDLYFVSDRGGVSDIYRLRPESGELFQVTRLATGVSGITALAPAITVAPRTGRLLFSVFESRGYGIYALEGERARGEPPGTIPAPAATIGVLPPVGAADRSVVSRYLEEPRAGLPDPARFTVTDYRPRLGLDYVGPPTIGLTTGQFGTRVGGGMALFFGDMLADRVLAVAAEAGGELEDLGGQTLYVNREGRWGWLGALGRTPYRSGVAALDDTTLTVDGQQVAARVVNRFIDRIFFDQALLTAQYPFSLTRRFEVSGGYQHIGFDRELEQAFFVGGREVGERELDLEAPEDLHFFQGAAAFVGDWSFFGFTSPISGGRYRFEAAPRLGTLRFGTLLADYRRYFFRRPVTFAVRSLHFGRYGRDAGSGRLSPLFLGEETLVRGYGVESFDPDECSRDGDGDDCPEFDRLVGSRIAVANAELRAPLFGTEGFGLIDFPYLPTELSAFVDAGVAWTGDDAPSFELARRSDERIPVFSAGVSARFNVLGYLILEAYYAYPFQRPDEGWHLGFQLAPGW